MKKTLFILVASLVLFFTLSASSCSNSAPMSSSGVRKADAVVVTQANGLTIEQQNVKDRLEMENKPGNIQHLYLISAYTGQIMLYSTVKGKITSSGKRLTPSEIYSSGLSSRVDGFRVVIGGENWYTKSVLGDDGTYGSSMEYLFWWDTAGAYHQQYISGGVTVTISDKPLYGLKSTIQQVEAVAK